MISRAGWLVDRCDLAYPDWVVLMWLEISADRFYKLVVIQFLICSIRLSTYVWCHVILGLILYDLLASYRYMIPDFDLVSMNDIC